MPKSDFTLRFINHSEDLRLLSERLMPLQTFAVDIETSDWWNRHRERIALIQIAYRQDEKIEVAVIDALADLDINLLRPTFEQSSVLKIIHNAAFDAARLKTHYDFNLAPMFDTMSAARRSGEKKYSLTAQAALHLKLHLDKSAQGSDWSRRPLDVRQLHYAALDPYATLLLYENQIKRGLYGDFRQRLPAESEQNFLPLENPSPTNAEVEKTAAPPETFSPKIELNVEMLAILGIITELPTRYSPDGLAASLGAERVGLAGWIIDRRLGVNAEPDEESVKLAISELCDKKLIEITETRRLHATGEGIAVWRELKKAA